MRRWAWLLATVLLFGCAKAPPRPMPTGGPGLPLRLVGLNYDKVPFASTVRAASGGPVALWVAGDQVAANRQLLLDQIQQGLPWMIIGPHLNWDALHQELALASPVALVDSTDRLQAFSAWRQDGVPRYLLVFGGGDALPPAGLLAEAGQGPQPSMAPHAALNGGPAYDLLATAVVAWAAPPYGWVRVSYTWYWRPGAPGGRSVFAVANRVQVRDGKYEAQGMGAGGGGWDSMVLDPASYRASARTQTFSLRDGTVQPGSSLDQGQLWLEGCRQPRAADAHAGPVEMDPLPAGIRSDNFTDPQRNLVQWNLRGGAGCAPGLHLPDQFIFWSGEQFLVSGPSGREPLTYRTDWTGTWQVTGIRSYTTRRSPGALCRQPSREHRAPHGKEEARRAACIRTRPAWGSCPRRLLLPLRSGDLYLSVIMKLAP